MPRYKYNHLRTLAFQLNPDITELMHRCTTLDFPEHWKRPLRELQAAMRNRPVDKATLPIYGLNQAMRTLVPDLLAIERGAGKSGERPWLYSAREIDPERLLLVIHAWVQAAFARASQSQRQHVLRELRAADLKWRSEDLNLAAWHAGEHGTAEASRRDSFVLLPDMLAAMLSRPDVSLDYGPAGLRFRRAPLAPGQKGAELVSWPPLWYTDRGARWPYSVVITLTAQTVPFQSYPLIHCDVGLRRWAGPSPRLPGGSTSVYLLTSVPWLRGMHESSSFQVASVRWRRMPSVTQSGKPTFSLIWGEYLTEMLNDLHPQHPFPVPQAIVDDPIQSLNLEGSPNAALIFRPGMEPEHGVGPGLMPPDRRALAEQLEAIFAPTLQFTQAPERVVFKVSGGQNPFFEDIRTKMKKDGQPGKVVAPEQRDLVLAQRRTMITQAIGKQLNIEIWHQSPYVREGMVRAVCEQFGLDRPAALPAVWSEADLAITLEAHELGPIAAELELDNGLSNERDRLQAAINQRVKLVANAMEVASPNTVALIELAGKEGYRSEPLSDPKPALRLAFARRGRLNQFITPGGDEKLEHKASSSLLDALRQLGIRPEMPRIDGLPHSLNVVGVWLVKQYESTSPTKTSVLLPVFVSYSTESPVIMATAPGLGDSWLPYHQALLSIADGEAHGYAKEHQVMAYIRQTLMNDVLPQGDTLLLCHAQNLRFAWPWLQNGHIARDTIAFGDEAPQPISRWPGLRVVRVRSNQGFETPEWYAQNPDEDEQGFTKGLFRMGERVFASTYDKPRQFQKLSPNLSKADAWTAPKSGKTFDASPNVHAWNPGLFELTVACLQPSDEGVDWPWAALAHALRDAAPHYDEATALALPLHLGQLMEEYVVSFDEIEDE